MKSIKFIRNIFIVAFVSLTLLSFPVYKFLNDKIFTAIFIGCILSFLSSSAGILLSEWSLSKSQKTFMATMVWGMFLRMAFIGISLVIAIKLFNVNVVFLLVSLFIYFFVFQILEIKFISNRKFI